MCGICGYIDYDGLVGEGDNQIIRSMIGKLAHRGPDAMDTLLFDNVALGFSRLSIIGLQNGMQPLFNEDESLVLICNGEIFNYIELKAELRKAGHFFKSDSDVEVILHLYEEYGTEFLNRLNGQFSFVLYDKIKKQLFCARDQMGIIPFYYTFIHNTFIFASEIKAILEHPRAPKEVDKIGLDQIFTFAGLISPRTMFKDISSLENGHWMLIDQTGKVSKKEYWDLIYPEGELHMNGKTEAHYVEKLESLFETSINLRLRSEVPTGLYLSGGLDSSMIVMKVNQLIPHLQKECFSIDFLDSLHSESNYQQLIARKSNSILNQHVFMSEDISERLRQSIYHSECPIKESYNTASLSLSESVRAKKIKVILSGEGADEFFAGYVGYRFDKMREMEGIKNTASVKEKQVRDRLWGDTSFFYERSFTDYEKIKRCLYSKTLNKSFDQINCLNYPILNKQRIKGRDIMNKRAYIDYKIRLVDHLVSDHGDRMAMANSVEVRYPFLDKDLIEFSAQIPSSLKLNGFTEKYILKKMADNFVPKEVTNREKFHFIAPGSPFLIQNKIEYINDILSHQTIKRQDYFNPDEIDNLKKKYGKKGYKINAPYENDLLITVITFGILLETFFE